MRELMMFAALVIAVLFVGRTEISLNPFYKESSQKTPKSSA